MPAKVGIKSYRYARKYASFEHGCNYPAVIKTHGSESQGQEEAACTSNIKPTRPLL